MTRIKKFVSKLLKDLFNEQDKKELIEILTTSLQEKVDDLVEAGTPMEAAIDQSIQEFGNAKDVLDAYPDKTNKNVLRHRRKNQILYSGFGYVAIVGIALYVNLQFSPSILWFVIIAIGMLFWPASMIYLYNISKK